MTIDDTSLNIINTICIGCRHYEGACECTAFPNGIPDEIIDGTVEHRKPYPGDNGIQFEAGKR
jgi:hypothetical protein